MRYQSKSQVRTNYRLSVIGSVIRPIHLWDSQLLTLRIMQVAAIVLGALQAWHLRHHMQSDGISYLDMGDAYLRGNWQMAVNAYWSPLYSWFLAAALHVLTPSMYWEFPIVHLVNFLLYLGALCCFDFFLRQLLHYHRNRISSENSTQSIALPQWSLFVFGYLLFIWSSLTLISMESITPDMCVAAFVYITIGILLRISMGLTSWLSFICLGAILGFSYLAKAPMFPLSSVFLGIALFSVGNLRKAVPRILIALFVFIVIAGPFLAAISTAKGHLTFGDSAKLNYAWFVNRIPTYAHWEGRSSPGNGIPKHPPRKLSEKPAVYEFAAPNRTTYPLWYDPSYWHEGLTLHIDVKQQLRPIAAAAMVYFDIFFREQSGLMVCLLILLLMTRSAWLGVNNIAKYWVLIIPALAALAMYSLVHVERRFVGAFVTLLWLGIACGIRLPDSKEARRLVTSVSITMLLVVTVTILAPTVYSFVPLLRKTLDHLDVTENDQSQIADHLRQIGINQGDKIAFVGDSFGAHWARLARVQIAAEIPREAARDFWTADESVRLKAIKQLWRTGVKAIVAEGAPRSAYWEGWQRIGKTDYAYIFH